jgi:predicted AlkP superfamily phosphohydrolase/phosphomutase
LDASIFFVLPRNRALLRSLIRSVIIDSGDGKGRSVSMRGKVVLVMLLVSTCLFTGCGKEEEADVSPEARAPLGRVVVVGFDGLEPTLVKKWVGEGKLPTLERIMQNGVFGDLVTVLPPSSASAWTSAVTGVHPGKHGIYGFLRESEPEWVYNISTHRGFAAVWEVLGDYGRTSRLINIPLTSPADSLNGLMVAGFPHTSEDPRSYYWPMSLEKYMGDYSFDALGVYIGTEKEERFLRTIDEIASRRLHLGLTLFDEGGWDLFWLVFTFTDRYQHYLWKYMDRNHPMYDPVKGRLYGTKIESAYVMADNFLAQFLERMQDEDLLILMSDHGFGYLYYTLNTANFIVRTLGETPHVVAADFFGGKFKIDVSGPNAEERYLSIRSRLVEGLKSLRDPVRDVDVIDSVYVKEDIYTGPYVATAPDIICVEKPGYLFFTRAKTPDLRLLDGGPHPDANFSGFHRRTGTIGLYGKRVRPGAAIKARITDITPTILSYLGVPAPRDIDGGVLRGAFTEETSGLVGLVRSERPGYRRPSGLSTQDSKSIEKQLRAVGYIQ